MIDDTSLPFTFPAVGRKTVSAAFDGGRITSDGGVMLLAEAERRLGIAGKLAAVIPDHRDPGRTVHALADILRARIFAIACGWEDACDLDSLRFDPAFKLACGRLPDSGRDLCSQPTMSRWENAPDLRSVIRLGRVLLDLWLASYPVPPAAVTLDIDDTCDVVHGAPCCPAGRRRNRCRSPRTSPSPPGGVPKPRRRASTSASSSPASVTDHRPNTSTTLSIAPAARPKTHALAKAEFATLRLRLLKVGVRVVETASRVRLAFAAACPEAAPVRHLATAVSPAGP